MHTFKLMDSRNQINEDPEEETVALAQVDLL